MDKDKRSRSERLDDEYRDRLDRRQELREKYFSENDDLRDIHINHDDGC